MGQLRYYPRSASMSILPCIFQRIYMDDAALQIFEFFLREDQEHNSIEAIKKVYGADKISDIRHVFGEELLKQGN